MSHMEKSLDAATLKLHFLVLQRCLDKIDYIWEHPSGTDGSRYGGPQSDRRATGAGFWGGVSVGTGSMPLLGGPKAILISSKICLPFAALMLIMVPIQIHGINEEINKHTPFVKSELNGIEIEFREAVVGFMKAFTPKGQTQPLQNVDAVREWFRKTIEDGSQKYQLIHDGIIDSNRTNESVAEHSASTAALC